jgi:hypothetical protein
LFFYEFGEHGNFLIKLNGLLFDVKETLGFFIQIIDRMAYLFQELDTLMHLYSNKNWNFKMEVNNYIQLIFPTGYVNGVLNI